MGERLENQEALISYCNELKTKAYKRGEQFHDEMADFANQLLAKYPDAREYRMFHVLISSTPRKNEVFQKFDFPGEDSIAKFLEEEAGKSDSTMER